MQIETVKIVSPVSDENPHGYIVINKSDLTDAHELFVDPKERSVAAAAPVAPAPPTRFANNQSVTQPKKK